MKDLLKMKEPDADHFFATRTSIGWMRDLENGDFAKVFFLDYKFPNGDFSFLVFLWEYLNYWQQLLCEYKRQTSFCAIQQEESAALISEALYFLTAFIPGMLRS